MRGSDGIEGRALVFGRMSGSSRRIAARYSSLEQITVVSTDEGDLIADSEELPFVRGTFACVLAGEDLNFVYHRRGEVGLSASFREMLRVLGPSGILGVSLWGVGTRSRLVAAYRAVMDRWELKGKAAASWSRDPFGEVELATAIACLEYAGGVVQRASLTYVPTYYPDAAAWWDKLSPGLVMALGAEVDTKHRSQLLDEIKCEFCGESTGGGFVDVRFQIQISAVRTAVLGGGLGSVEPDRFLAEYTSSVREMSLLLNSWNGETGG